MSAARRIGGLVLRHLYIFRGSWPRLVELVYWPAMQMVLWGLITSFLLTNSSWLVRASGALIAGVLLWDTLLRAQMGVSISLLEEMWSRNLGQLFVSPLSPAEFGGALLIMSVLRTLLAMVPTALLAMLLYGYSIFSLGLPLVAFFTALLVFGWAVGLLIAAMLIRYGLAAESFAWAAIFVLAPVSAVYYPVSTLPPAVQWVAWAMPPAHVFEGMRAVLMHGTFDPALLLGALGLDVLYLALAFAVFLWSFQVARDRGLLLGSRE